MAQWQLFEAEILEGLKPFAMNELQSKFGKDIDIQKSDETAILFYYRGDFARLLDLRTVVALYDMGHFAIPRPKALLGHETLEDLVYFLHLTLDRYPKDTFKTFRFSAAGKESSTFERLRQVIAQETGLTYHESEGDLFVRFRPSQIEETGWDVMVRITPRPLATRAWRVCDMKGALNGTIAASMIALTEPQRGEVFLNLMSGSGTLLIERADRHYAKAIIGIDHDENMLKCATQNIEAAKLSQPIAIQKMDATHTEFEDKSFDSLVVDLPWGQSIGAHEHNQKLYPEVLHEAARIAKPKAHFVVLTHEITLFEALLPDYERFWKLRRTVKVFQGGLHPRIYVLERAY
jgi:tRNA (guanine6-N2)-methyltransferase